MPRYYFDILDGGDLQIDHVGSLCADDTAAIDEARRCVIEMASERRGEAPVALKIAVSGADYSNIISVSLDMKTHRRGLVPTQPDNMLARLERR